MNEDDKKHFQKKLAERNEMIAQEMEDKEIRNAANKAEHE